MRNLVRRLKRALAKQDMMLDDYRGRTVATVWKEGKDWKLGFADAEQLGRELGVLRPWETVNEP
jgi:hypothetical protein